MNNDFNVIIQAILDQSGIKKGLVDAQKFLNENLVKIIPQIDSTSLKNNLKSVSNDLANAMNKQFGSNLTGNDVFRLLNQQINQTSVSAKALASDLSRLNKVKTIETWAANNTRAASTFGKELDEIKLKLNSLNVDLTREEMDSLSRSFVNIQMSARQAGMLGLSVFDRAQKAISKFGGWSIVTGGVMQVVHSFGKMVDSVKEVNSANIELSKVSEATATDIKNYFSDAADSAKELGAGINDVINATADWSRLGYNLPDASELAEIATLYKNVGDGIDIETANESLISTLQGFQLDVSDAMRIIDSFNETANNFPIDSAGIGDALQRSAASFYAANTDLEKSIALITGANAVVQDPSSVGNMWKTVSMRIRGTKQELEDAGEETDGMVESTSQLRDLIKGLTGFDIMADDAGTEFKDIYDIVVGIGNEWKNLTNVEQAGLLETLAGKRQGNALSAALNNISMIEEAYDTASNSAGSALKEQQNYEKGIQYSLDRATASFQEFSNTAIESDTIKGIVDFGNGFLNVLTQIIDKFGILKPAIAGVGITAFIKNLDWLEMPSYKESCLDFLVGLV